MLKLRWTVFHPEISDRHKSVWVLMAGSGLPSHFFLISNKCRNPTPHSSPNTVCDLRPIIRAQGPISRWAITTTKCLQSLMGALFDGGRWSERWRKEGLWDYSDCCDILIERKLVYPWISDFWPFVESLSKEQTKHVKRICQFI